MAEGFPGGANSQKFVPTCVEQTPTVWEDILGKETEMFRSWEGKHQVNCQNKSLVLLYLTPKSISQAIRHAGSVA